LRRLGMTMRFWQSRRLLGLETNVVLTAPILGWPVARLRGAPIPIARFCRIHFNAGAGFKTARIKIHAKGVVLFRSVAEKADGFLRAQRFIFSQVGCVTR